MGLFGSIGGVGGWLAGNALGGSSAGGVGAAIGSFIGGTRDEQIAEARRQQERADNIALQREFAQNGIRWRVEDAQAAGIHPLAALGAPGTSFSPISVDGSGGDSGMAQMGQDVIRSLSATRTHEERQMQQLQLATARTQLDGQVIDNQIKATQLRQMQSVGPAFPSPDGSFIPGQGNSGSRTVQVNPAQRVVSEPGSRGKEAGTVNDFTFAETPTGLAVVPSKDIKERIEDQMVPEAAWALRNQIIPFFKGPMDPSKIQQKPPAGMKWQWNGLKQEYTPVPAQPKKYKSRKEYIDQLKY